MKKNFLPAVLVLLAASVFGAQIQAEDGRSYLLATGDALVFGEWSVRVADAAPPDAIAIRVFYAGEERVGFSRLQKGLRLELSFASLELRSFENVNGSEFANVFVETPKNAGAGNASQASGTPAAGGQTPGEGTPPASTAGGSGRAGGQAAGVLPTERKTPGELVAQGYPARQVDASAENNFNCAGALAVKAVIVGSNEVVQGENASVILEDSFDLTPMPATPLKVVYPSGIAFVLVTDEAGAASFAAVERGSYELRSFGCYELAGFRVFARHPELPARLRDFLPAPLAEFVSTNLEATVLYAVLLALVAGVAWFWFSFAKENVDLEDAYETVKKKARELREKIGGDEAGQTAIEYLLVLGGVLLLAAAVIYIVRSQVSEPVKDSISTGVQNFSRLLDSFSKS